MDEYNDRHIPTCKFDNKVNLLSCLLASLFHHQKCSAIKNFDDTNQSSADATIFILLHQTNQHMEVNPYSLHIGLVGHG